DTEEPLGLPQVTVAHGGEGGPGVTQVGEAIAWRGRGGLHGRAEPSSFGKRRRPPKVAMATAPQEVTEISAGGHPVVLGRDALRALDRRLGVEDHSAAFILGDENTLRHCLPELLAQVPRLRDARTLVIPPGERSKDIAISGE